jgi:hypothetical protein
MSRGIDRGFVLDFVMSGVVESQLSCSVSASPFMLEIIVCLTLN